MVNLSIITPTHGRKALLMRFISSVLPQLGPQDQLIVVGDGPLPETRKLVAEVNDDRLVYMEYKQTHHWGVEQLDYGIRHATGDFLVFSGDDDMLAPTALETIRAKVAGTTVPHLFAMQYGDRVFSGETGCGGVSGQQLVVPKGCPVRYAEDIGESGDHSYIVSVIKHYRALTIHSEIINILEQRRGGNLT